LRVAAFGGGAGGRWSGWTPRSAGGSIVAGWWAPAAAVVSRIPPLRFEGRGIAFARYPRLAGRAYGVTMAFDPAYARFGPGFGIGGPIALARAYDGKDRPVRWRVPPRAASFGWVDLGDTMTIEVSATFATSAAAASAEKLGQQAMGMARGAGDPAVMAVLLDGVAITLEGSDVKIRIVLDGADFDALEKM